MHAIAILGSVLNGGACQIIDAATSNAIQHTFLLYDDIACLNHSKHLGFDIRGGIQKAFEDHEEGRFSFFVVGVCSLPARRLIYDNALAHGLKPINIISERAILANSALVGHGNVILPSSYIGPGTILGDNNYITTGTHINHDCIIGSGNYFSTCVAVAGRVKIGNNVRLGTNCTLVADSVVPSEMLVEDGCVFR